MSTLLSACSPPLRIFIINKADDSFLEATTGGLSDQPVLTSQGSFLRYEILINPAFYNHVVENRYYDWNYLYNTLDQDVANLCGEDPTQAETPPTQGPDV